MSLDLLASTDAEPAAADAPAIPDPFGAVPPSLQPALRRKGFEALTSVQTAVLEAEVEGRDLQISSQTGSGKTVAVGFVLARCLEGPKTCKGPDALVIVPTRELALQVCDELSWLLAGLPRMKVAAVTGGSPIYRDRQVLARGPRVVVGTPGRLLDHVSTGVLDLANVGELVLDEADEMLDMGFREELEGILDRTPGTRRTHLVSATFPEGIQRLARRYQTEPFMIAGTRPGEANRDIEHVGHLVHSHDRYGAIVNLLLEAGNQRTLIFVQQRAETMELSARLEADGFNALPLSGELAQSQRVRTLDAFRSGRTSVLVATDVAARGLDVQDVMLVIHTTPPLDPQVYTHRSGRTGRAGMRGRSVLLAAPNRRRRVTRLLADAGVEIDWRPVPSAADVRNRIATREREALEKDLDTIFADGVSAAHMDQAEKLLSGREAVPLVAALLSRLEPAGRARPRDIETPREEREFRRPERRGHGAPFRRDTRPGDMVRFFVNCGDSQGATPGRLLAMICRRGGVKGTDVGSIAIHLNASTFDVRRSVAERFERSAGKRDPRDPKIRIRRDRGSR